MPKVKTKKKKFPRGFEVLEETLEAFETKMREATADEGEGKRKTELLWPIMRLHHQRSRYVFEMFYKDKKISREVYEYCLRESYADAALIAKWKKVVECIHCGCHGCASGE